ncbi:MAG: DUF2933 domain-containing protein [Hyphomonadaceae bacterium]|nr:DUF2933 domain-containing protein [Hyphomonadaceae bacterium]
MEARRASQGLARGFLIMLVTAVAAGVAFCIPREHLAHALGFAPYLLFLACPLMHLFTRGGHKHVTGSPDAQPASPTLVATNVFCGA